MRTIEKFAQALKKEDFKKIAVMTGAGISVNAGIPDFRSKTGLYSKLKNPELVFDINHFIKNPQFFYDNAPSIITPEAQPTLTHYFISFLESKGLMQICYSQNIDGLERKAGVKKVVQAHGNIDKAHCALCRKDYSRKDVVDAMRASKVMYCDCKGPIKPDVVFFGESLPKEFEMNLELVASADLLIVMGTSLVVRPFSSLVNHVGFVPRIVINNTDLKSFGDIGLDFSDNKMTKDVLFVGDTDEISRKIISFAGWKEEFYEKFKVKI
ncbi:hypothetical protein SteCoe_18027 [Stentor coeruleus]|uniref:Deacetylase sirtuin-type domain-containing protein n=1 Tax=Stentor coeruleus TaxID=5963 RepID=A0A1R2BY13_9CILI|nr:hypothetical protein SteCoe_18027 [Stentor coeruleus]